MSGIRLPNRKQQKAFCEVANSIADAVDANCIRRMNTLFRSSNSADMAPAIRELHDAIWRRCKAFRDGIEKDLSRIYFEHGEA